MQPNCRIKDDEIKNWISPLLQKVIDLTDSDITLLIDFLDHLEDNQEHNRGMLIPKSVPSGLPIHMIQNAQNLKIKSGDAVEKDSKLILLFEQNSENEISLKSTNLAY